jgi:D-sedoheptulose 7-phosphate isomerase
MDESAAVKRAVGERLSEAIAAAADAILHSLQRGGTLFLCGNGGSAADSQHLAAELTGRFMIERPAYRAIALTTDTSALTAIGNDYGYERVFERQISGLGRAGDALVLITTSGNSQNLLLAADRARELGIITIGFLGKGGGALAGRVDIPLVVPSENGMHVQEAHIAIGHAVCLLVERGLTPQG